MRNILLGRTYNVSGSWYAPKQFLNDNFSSVVKTGLIDTTSSAGDWFGYLVQHIKKTYYLIFFSQSNNYPYSGFKVMTHEVCFKFKEIPTEEKICDIAKIWF